jgi:hypothetical protein
MSRYKSDYGVNNLENGVEFYFDIDKSNNWDKGSISSWR